MNLNNIIFRIVAAPYIAQNIISGNFPLACGLFVYAGATDFLDGYIARNFKNQSSSLGSFLDPLSDKILVGMMTFKYIQNVPKILCQDFFVASCFLCGSPL